MEAVHRALWRRSDSLVSLQKTAIEKPELNVGLDSCEGSGAEYSSFRYPGAWWTLSYRIELPGSGCQRDSTPPMTLSIQEKWQAPLDLEHEEAS